jgi:hypothetical protein
MLLGYAQQGGTTYRWITEGMQDEAAVRRLLSPRLEIGPTTTDLKETKASVVK